MIINIDYGKVRTGKSVFGEEYQIDVSSKESITQDIVNRLRVIDKEVKRLRRSRLIHYHTAKRYAVSSKAKQYAVSSYDKTFVAVVRKNEQIRRDNAYLNRILVK